MRGVFVIVVDGLCRLYPLSADAERFAGIEISVETGEIAAGDFDSDFVAGQKGIARYPEIDFVTVKLARLNQIRIVLRVAIAGAENAVAEIVGLAIGMDVHELGRPVGVFRGRDGIKNNLHRPGDFQLALECFAGENQNVVSFLDLGLVLRSHRAADEVAPTGRGNGIVRIVHEFVAWRVGRLGCAQCSVAFGGIGRTPAMKIVGGIYGPL